MCRFKSAIATKSGEIYHSPYTDSHSDLIDLYKVKDGVNPQFTPVEFVSVDVFDPEEFRLVFDAERPDWADDDWVELVSKKLRSVIKEMIVNGEHKTLAGGAYIIGDKARVAKIIQGRILAVHTGANLTRANLTGASLYWANLTGANLTGANLTGASLTWANLTGANLTGANLYGATLDGANLTGANLTGASLYGANLTGATLTGANLDGAYRATDAPAGWEIKNGILVRDQPEA